jgi:hypothetical protein
MGRSAILLALLGLAVGLWLGFNPTTHRELNRWWTRTTAGQASAGPSSAANLRQLDRRLNQFLRTQPRPASQPQAASSPVPTARQISATLQAFWHALQQIWARLLMKLDISRV